MTISTTTNRTSTVGDGVVTQFSFPYLFFATDDLTVILVTTASGAEVTQTITTHYTVAGTGVTAGGTVTMGTAPASTETLVIIRKEQFTQGLDLVENDPFPSDLVEQQFDTLTMLAQQMNTDISRSVKLADGDTSGADVTLPTPVADGYLKWNAAGDAMTSSSTSAGQSLGGNGTVSLPFYSFSADPDSGFYRIGANNIAVSLNGTKVVDYGTATVAFSGEVTGTGFTGSLDGILGAGTPAAATVTQLTSGGDVLSDTDSTDSLGSTGVRWLKLWVDSIQTTANTDIAGNLTVTGNLTINGTTVTNDATNTTIKDPLIEINSGASSNANDLGLLMERGSTGDNAFLGWDESGDYFVAATTTAVGSSTGNISYSFAPFKCSAITATAGTLAGITSLALNAGATITAGILDEDAMGSNSAVALATQQSIKAYTDNNAPENGVKFAWESTTTDTDQGAGKVWLNNGTPSSATVLYVDDVEAGSVSVNAWVDTWDDVSNTVARGYVYIASYGTTNAILVFKVTGAVTSASTYSKIAVTHVLTVGTISDGDNIGLTFVPSGADGSGDMNDVVDDTTPQLGGFLDANSKFISHSQGAAIASVAGDTNIWTNFDGNTVHITGTNAITDFGTPKSAGDSMWVIFDAAASVVDSATITVAGNTNYQAAANDLALVYALTTSTFLFMPFPNSGSSPVYDADTLKADTDDTLTAGFAATADADGTKTSGTYTPTTAGGNFKTATNGGAHTLAPQSEVSTIIIQYTNDSSAGSVTVSGWDSVTGDSLSTTNGDDFMCYLTVIGGFQHLHVVALQ
jgi:hypothetical protein